MPTNKEMPPMPLAAKLLDAQGYISGPWAGFMRQLLYRIGGFVALTNTQLASGGTGASVVGSRGAPTSVVAAGGLPFTANGQTINFITGSGGAVIVSANPQIQAGTVVGQLLKVVGCNDTNTVEFQNGTGLQLAGAIVLGLTSATGRSSSVDLFWDGANWVEAART